MTAAKFSPLRWGWFGALFLAVLIVYSVTLAPGLTWKNDGADGGDLIAAAARLGVAHPSGYPTYLLLVRLFQFIPFGSLAGRTALFSAVCASIAALLTVFVIRQSAPGLRRYGWVGGLLAGLAFGLSPLLWSQAVIAEVYSLHMAFVAAALLCIVVAAETDQIGWLTRLGGLLFGLGLGNHLTLIFLLPPWLFVLGWRKGKLTVRPVIESLLTLALGLLVYLYIPLRAAAQPPVNWGNASTGDGFLWVVTARNYRGLVFGLSSDLIINRIQAWAALLIAQFSWPGLMLALYGLFYGRPSSPYFKPITLWMMAAYSIFAIGYGTADSDAYLLPAFLAMAIWFGWGVVTALNDLPWEAARAPLVAVVALIIFAHAVQTLPQVDASQDHAAEDYLASVLKSAPPNAIVFTSNDRDTFPLWYAQFALGQRPDLTIVVEPLLIWPWYSQNLHSTYPTLSLPAESLTRTSILAQNKQPWCVTQSQSPASLICTNP